MNLQRNLEVLTLLTAVAGASSAQGAVPPPQEATACPLLLRAETGAQAILHDPEGRPLGTIRDHVVKLRDGRVLSVVVRTDTEHDVLVPWSELKWSQERGELILPATAQQLAALPAFEPGALQELGTAPGEEPLDDGEVRNALGSELVRREVSARDGQLDPVQGLLLEPARGTVALLLLAPGAAAKEQLPVPWQALRFQPRTGFRLDRNLAEMEEAPRLDPRELPALKRERVESIFRFYHVPLPELRQAG